MGPVGEVGPVGPVGEVGPVGPVGPSGVVGGRQPSKRAWWVSRFDWKLFAMTWPMLWPTLKRVDVRLRGEDRAGESRTGVQADAGRRGEVPERLLVEGRGGTVLRLVPVAAGP